MSLCIYTWLILSGKNKKYDTVDTDKVVASRISYICKEIFGRPQAHSEDAAGDTENPEGRMHEKLRAGFKEPNTSLREWKPSHSWVRQPPEVSHVAGTDSMSKYLSYGVVAYCVDNQTATKGTNIIELKNQNTTPKVWVCALC